MFGFHIYSSFETEGHCRDQGDFYLLKTIISFYSGKTKMKKNRITIIISPWKTCLYPSEMQKCNCIVLVKTKMSLKILFWCTNDCPYFEMHLIEYYCIIEQSNGFSYQSSR